MVAHMIFNCHTCVPKFFLVTCRKQHRILCCFVCQLNKTKCDSDEFRGVAGRKAKSLSYQASTYLAPTHKSRAQWCPYVLVKCSGSNPGGGSRESPEYQGFLGGNPSDGRPLCALVCHSFPHGCGGCVLWVDKVW